MKIIGVTGGVGAGKSTVLKMLTQICPCQIIMADDVAKNIMNKGGPLTDDAVCLFGENAYNSDGTLNTGHIAEVMYNNDELRNTWNCKVHPVVNQKIKSLIEEAKTENKVDFVFIEAALLIENNYDKICDELWYIYASEDIRKERLMRERKYSDRKIQSIFNSQLKEADFRKYCKTVIDTGVSLEHTKEQLIECVSKL